jgi:hypothetical protein
MFKLLFRKNAGAKKARQKLVGPSLLFFAPTAFIAAGVISLDRRLWGTPSPFNYYIHYKSGTEKSQTGYAY